MPINVYYSKQNKTSYVYETEYYYDKDTQKTKCRKKLIGKIDPVTGEMIPTGKKGCAPKPKKARKLKESSDTPSLPVETEGDLTTNENSLATV